MVIRSRLFNFEFDDDEDVAGYSNPLRKRIRRDFRRERRRQWNEYDGLIEEEYQDDDDDEDVAGSSNPLRKRVRRDFPWESQSRQWNEYDGPIEEEYQDDYDDEISVYQEDEEYLGHDLGGYQYDDEEQDYVEDNGEDEAVPIEYEEEEPNYYDDPISDDALPVEYEEEEPNYYDPISDEPINVTLNDPRAFDCPICFEPLTIPVFQCDNNGHIACNNCSSKIQRCPSCSSSFGSSRCRAIEKVLESSTTSCRNSKYGCKETMTYDKKREHERECMHLPCSCPHSGCDFVASYRNLYKHFKTVHVGSATPFRYNRDFTVTLKKNEKFTVLQERNVGTMFILKNSVIEGAGNALRLTCLQPSFLEESYYELGAKTDGNLNLRLQSYTKSSPNHVYDGSPLMANFLLIPVNFFRSSDQLRMNLCISPNGDQPLKY